MIVAFVTDGVVAPPGQSSARRAVLLTLARHGQGAEGELNVVWTDRARLKKMNRRFRGRQRFTDVIAFRYGDLPGEKQGALSSGEPFGDLYIAVDQARKNAGRFGVSWREEIVRLATHGTLHLLGYTDYEAGPRARMWAAQEPIVRETMGRGSRGRGTSSGVPLSLGKGRSDEARRVERKKTRLRVR